MNPPAAQILAMSVHRAIGSRIKYRSDMTKRIRTGTIKRISGSGVVVSNDAGACPSEVVTWGGITEIVKEGK